MPAQINPDDIRESVWAIANRLYADALAYQRTDPQRRTYYWLGGEIPDVEEDDDVDNTAVRQGYISVTPIQYDLTDYAALECLRSWSFD